MCCSSRRVASIRFDADRYPCFENQYPMDLHESPVTCCRFVADCPADLVPALYAVGRQSRQDSSAPCTGFNESGGRERSGSAANVLGGGSGSGSGGGFTFFGKELLSSLIGDSVSGADDKSGAPASPSFSTKEWPITGGLWGSAISSSQEIFITGYFPARCTVCMCVYLCVASHRITKTI